LSEFFIFVGGLADIGCCVVAVGISSVVAIFTAAGFAAAAFLAIGFLVVVFLVTGLPAVLGAVVFAGNAVVSGVIFVAAAFTVTGFLADVVLVAGFLPGVLAVLVFVAAFAEVLAAVVALGVSGFAATVLGAVFRGVLPVGFWELFSAMMSFFLILLCEY